VDWGRDRARRGSEGIEEDGGDRIGGWRRRRWEGARGEEDVGGG
jgi:hypothetical protein